MLPKPVKVLDVIIIVDTWIEFGVIEELTHGVCREDVIGRVGRETHVGTVFNDGFAGDMEVNVHVCGGVHSRLYPSERVFPMVQLGLDNEVQQGEEERRGGVLHVESRFGLAIFFLPDGMLR